MEKNSPSNNRGKIIIPRKKKMDIIYVLCRPLNNVTCRARYVLNVCSFLTLSSYFYSTIHIHTYILCVYYIYIYIYYILYSSTWNALERFSSSCPALTVFYCRSGFWTCSQAANREEDNPPRRKALQELPVEVVK